MRIDTKSHIASRMRGVHSEAAFEVFARAMTQDGIDAWQQDRRKRFGAVFDVDGIFSVAPPTRTNYAKETPYSIVGVNYILMVCTPTVWPRLDKHPLAGPIAAAIRKAISPDLTG